LTAFLELESAIRVAEYNALKPLGSRLAQA